MLNNELQALISLIEDPDENVFSHVSSTLTSMGDAVLPQLEQTAGKHTYGDAYQMRIEGLISSIQQKGLSHKVKTWKDDCESDLLDGVLLINKHQCPDLNVEEVREAFAKMRQEIWLELNDQLTGFESVKVFNHMFFEEFGFAGNKLNYYAPQDSLISEVLKSKKGSPLSLSIIYMVLAQSLELPVYGVNLPSHFILCYLDENNIFSIPELEEDNDGVLFYINPFSGGNIILKKEIEEFLVTAQQPDQIDYYKPCSNQDIVMRLMTNLIYSYSQQGDQERVEALKTLQNVFSE